MGVTLTWLGQSGFIIDDGRQRVACDLYLSDHLERKYRDTDKPHDRLHPSPIGPGEVGPLTWVFASHRHSDHLDPGSIADVLRVTGARLLLPMPLVSYATEDLKIDAAAVVGVGPGDEVGPFRFVAAAHPERSDAFLSAFIDLGGLLFFHSGDTLRFGEQEDELAAAHPDVVLLPVNGRVAEHLGTPPNMSLDEAIGLAAHCRASLMVPHHYDMFAFNSVAPDTVARGLTASDVPHRVMAVGETITLERVGGRVEVAA